MTTEPLAHDAPVVARRKSISVPKIVKKLETKLEPLPDKENVPPPNVAKPPIGDTEEAVPDPSPARISQLGVHIKVHVQGRRLSAAELGEGRQLGAAAGHQEEEKAAPATESADLSEANRRLLETVQDGVQMTLHCDQQLNRPEGALARHSVTPLVRAKMINWLVEVLSIYKLSRRTLFLAVALMDNYYLRTEKILTEDDIHLTGVTCMFIACKLEEVTCPRLSAVCNQIAHGQLTKTNVREKEQEIVSTLGFRLLFTTSLHLLEFYFALMADRLRRAAQPVPADLWELMQKWKDGSVLYCMMGMYDYQMLKYYPSTMAAGAIYATAMKLSRMYQRQCDGFLSNCINSLTCEDKENVEDMEKTAKDIIRLENVFPHKYAGMFNLFLRQLPA